MVVLRSFLYDSVSLLLLLRAGRQERQSEKETGMREEQDKQVKRVRKVDVGERRRSKHKMRWSLP